MTASRKEEGKEEKELEKERTPRVAEKAEEKEKVMDRRVDMDPDHPLVHPPAVERQAAAHPEPSFKASATTVARSGTRLLSAERSNVREVSA